MTDNDNKCSDGFPACRSCSNTGTRKVTDGWQFCDCARGNAMHKAAAAPGAAPTEPRQPAPTLHPIKSDTPVADAFLDAIANSDQAAAARRVHTQPVPNEMVSIHAHELDRLRRNAADVLLARAQSVRDATENDELEEKLKQLHKRIAALVETWNTALRTYERTAVWHKHHPAGDPKQAPICEQTVCIYSWVLDDLRRFGVTTVVTAPDQAPEITTDPNGRTTRNTLDAPVVSPAGLVAWFRGFVEMAKPLGDQVPFSDPTRERLVWVAEELDRLARLTGNLAGDYLIKELRGLVALVEDEHADLLNSAATEIEAGYENCMLERKMRDKAEAEVARLNSTLKATAADAEDWRVKCLARASDATSERERANGYAATIEATELRLQERIDRGLRGASEKSNTIEEQGDVIRELEATELRLRRRIEELSATYVART